MNKYKVTTMRQVGGDDGYQWAVFVNGKMRVNGCTKREATEYRQQFEREEAAKANRVTITSMIEHRQKVRMYCSVMGWPVVAISTTDGGRSSIITVDTGVAVDCDQVASELEVGGSWVKVTPAKSTV